MGKRTDYQREYQRKRRAADPAGARAESREAYKRRIEAEAADPSMRERRRRLAREWADAHLDVRAEQARRYYDRIRSTSATYDEWLRSQRVTAARYRRNPLHRVKVRARWRAARALRDGRLQRQPCRDCGAERVEMHHPDYRRALDVIWLCKAHHEAAHRPLRLVGHP